MLKLKRVVLILVAALAAVGPAASAPASAGYVLNMYHFNIQYVVGSEASMRRIIDESFEPLVDFYLAHPGWGADFEMQGLMIEYMAEKRPEALAKFRRLVNSGQAELVTFHYSDQLLLAFPGHDQEWSLKLNDRILAENDVKRSGVIFTQEAQYGEGMSELGKSRGYEIAVMTSGDYGWFQDDDRFPYFTVGGMDLLVNRSTEEPSSGIKVKWTFLGDGELVATAGISPYFPGLFKTNPLKLKALEERFKKLEAEGYKIATVTEYVGALRAAGVKPEPLEPILDSPWRPGDGSGVLQWMGRYSLPWEKDYDIRTLNWRVRRAIIEAERAGADEGTLLEAWGYMLNAEVSDPTGWYPFPVEIKWDYRMMEAAMAALGRDLAELRGEAELLPGAEPIGVGESPLAARLFGRAGGGELRWSRYPDRPGVYAAQVAWRGKGDGGVAFPWTAEAVEYSPAMMEDIIRTIPVSELAGRTIHLGLPNGLIGLGDGVYLVRDNEAGCVAGGLYFEDREVRFEIQKGREESYSFIFYLLKGRPAEAALKFANELNEIEP